jgi:hypothetical protein
LKTVLCRQRMLQIVPIYADNSNFRREHDETELTYGLDSQELTSQSCSHLRHSPLCGQEIPLEGGILRFRCSRSGRILLRHEDSSRILLAHVKQKVL